MSTEATLRAELLQLRKSAEAVTVGSLARTSALRVVLGGGDARIAFNTLQHLLLAQSDSLSITAVGYSLGYASDEETHLGRLTAFGEDFGYDQRQARRYSDRGVDELARRIATENVLEATPTLDIEMQPSGTAEGSVRLVLRTERFGFVQMRTPVVETVGTRGGRKKIACRWQPEDQSDDLEVEWSIASVRDLDRRALSVLWVGEVWPRLTVVVDERLKRTVSVMSLGARVQVSLSG